MKELIQSTICSAYLEMGSKDMDMPSIQGYIRHLPIIGIEGGYSKEIYVDTTKCIIAMWKYAKETRLISPDTSFMDFMGKDIGFKSSDKETRKMYKLNDGRAVDWKEYLDPLRKLAASLLQAQTD